MKSSTRLAGACAVGFFVGAIVGPSLGWRSFRGASEDSPEPSDEAALQGHRRPFLAAPFQGPGGNRPPGSSDTDLPDGITAEEHQELMTLTERQEKGDCVLAMEGSLRRKTYQEIWDSAVATAEAHRRTDGHPALFADLGLTPQQAERFDRHLSQIVRASAEAESALAQLHQARYEYNELIGSTLSPDSAKRYRDFEEDLRGSHDLAKFGEFLTEHQVAVDADSLSKVSSLIASTGARTFESWEGPFDGTSSPAVGETQVIQKLERDLAQLTERGESLRSAAAQAGLPPEVAEQLNSYYAEQLRTKQEELRIIRGMHLDPGLRKQRMDEIRAENLRRSEELRRRRGK